MDAKQMLDLRADLAARLDHPRVRLAMAGTIRAGGGGDRWTQADLVVDYTRRSILKAENFFVVRDMTDLVEQGASVLDASDLADVTLVPSESGFAYFEKPLRLVDIRQSEILVNAVLWDTTGDDTVVIHMWNDEYRTPDAASLTTQADALVPKDLTNSERRALDELLKVRGRWGYVGVVLYVNGEQIGDERVEVSEELAEQYADVEGVQTAPFSNPKRFLHSLWLMLNQTLVERGRDFGDRRFARRMKRMGLPNDVTIIRFRRTEYTRKHEGEAHVEWSHRWLVRGFWRWQPYKNEKGEWDRKRIWINPFIKGPEDKPLVITNKINAFVR